MGPAGLNTRLVADIGGTNSRLGLFDAGSGQLSAVQYYTHRDYPSFAAVVQDWLDGLGAHDHTAPGAGCLAVAAWFFQFVLATGFLENPKPNVSEALAL